MSGAVNAVRSPSGDRSGDVAGSAHREEYATGHEREAAGHQAAGARPA
jgi:hypothetical protein